MDYSIIIYIIFGILPSLAWLTYYLKKDLHPEPKRKILEVFLWGALITIPVFFIQIGFTFLLGKISFNSNVSAIIYWFLIISFSEELFKYLVVKMRIFDSPDLDEPLDIMLYMVVAALGFAALENILYLFSPIGTLSFGDLIGKTLVIVFIRFIGATFLHTLCSAVIGYAVAISLFDQKNSFIEATAGVVVAVLLHGLYDFSIMTLKGYMQFLLPGAIILTLALIVFSSFERLKKLKGITVLNNL